MFSSQKGILCSSLNGYLSAQNDLSVLCSVMLELKLYKLGFPERTWSPSQIPQTGGPGRRRTCSFLLASCLRNGLHPCSSLGVQHPLSFYTPHCSFHEKSGQTPGRARSSKLCFSAGWAPYLNTEVRITSTSLCSPAQGVVTSSYLLLSVGSQFSQHF